MSHRSTPLRFHLLAAAFWLTAMASAFAQEAPEITVRLTPAEVAEIARLVDLQPISISPPAAYWDLQTKLGAALDAAGPEAGLAFLAARSATR
jgi:hypothetical protein